MHRSVFSASLEVVVKKLSRFSVGRSQKFSVCEPRFREDMIAKSQKLLLASIQYLDSYLIIW